MSKLDKSKKKASVQIETMDVQKRSFYGELAGIVGVVVNILLSVSKFFVGALSGSVSISADAVNNLSDAGSSILTWIGFRVSKRPADKNHPYGHGRLEYIMAFIVSFLILFMGTELLETAIDKIRNPEPITFHWLTFWVLCISILCKIGLACFHFYVGKKIQSSAATASAKDSLSDTFATGVALLSLVASKFICAPLDGWFSLIVSGFVFWAGCSVLKETIGLLLGKPPSEEFLEEIEQEILSYNGVVGVHDLIVHDYGPGRLFASAHAEVPANVPIMESHDVIDNIEREIHEKYGMLISIHLDPIVTDDAHVLHLKSICQTVLNSIDEKLTFHDFRVVDGPTHTNLIFDIVLPVDYSKEPKEITEEIQKKLSKIDERYFSVITVDHAFH